MVFARTTLRCGAERERDIRSSSSHSSPDNSMWIGVCCFGMPALSFRFAPRQFFYQRSNVVTFLRGTVLSRATATLSVDTYGHSEAAPGEAVPPPAGGSGLFWIFDPRAYARGNPFSAPLFGASSLAALPSSVAALLRRTGRRTNQSDTRLVPSRAGSGGPTLSHGTWRVQFGTLASSSVS